MDMVIVAGVVVVVLVTTTALFMIFDSGRWPTASGEVVLSGLEEAGRREEGVSPEYNYRITLSYRYSVDGVEYTGDRLYAMLPNVVQSEEAGRALLDTFGAGSTPQVYYHPGNPARSCLIPGSVIPRWMFGALAVGLLLVASAIIVVTLAFTE